MDCKAQRVWQSQPQILAVNLAKLLSKALDLRGITETLAGL